MDGEGGPVNGPEDAIAIVVGGRAATIRSGAVAIAAITSCTNTSNPTVMVGAGLLARNAVARGLSVGPTVKTSLAPGSSLSQSTSYTTGVTKTETDSFTEQIGVQAGGDVYGSLSAQLSFSFSATETHSIATTESKTETTTITLSGSPDKSVSYQVWQLVIRFATVSGPYIDQLIDTAIAPLISTEAYSDN
jgi:hypothetical protein